MKKLVAIGAAAFLSSTAHALTITPNLVDFKYVMLGGSSEMLITVYNGEGQDARNLVIGVSGKDDEYVIKEDPHAEGTADCVFISEDPVNYSLGDGQSCSFYLELRPTHPGAKRKTLTVDGIGSVDGAELTGSASVVGFGYNENMPFPK